MTELKKAIAYYRVSSEEQRVKDIVKAEKKSKR